MNVSSEKRPDVSVRISLETSDDPRRGVESEEALLQSAIDVDLPHLRFWVNAPCLVIGRGYARRLPRRVDQVDGTPVLIRSSGGEIVIHGPGVLNISLAVPTTVWKGTIDETFVGLSEGVKDALIDLGWRATVGEIPMSYCPGDHDVAVDGKKVMGISQRRIREGVLVHGSLNVSIDPLAYAHMLVQFYEAAGIDERPIAERIGTLVHEPAAHPADCPVAVAIRRSMLDSWTRRTGQTWIEVT